MILETLLCSDGWHSRAISSAARQLGSPLTRPTPIFFTPEALVPIRFQGDVVWEHPIREEFAPSDHPATVQRRSHDRVDGL